jgi:hypothetical protein
MPHRSTAGESGPCTDTAIHREWKGDIFAEEYDASGGVEDYQNFLDRYECMV